MTLRKGLRSSLLGAALLWATLMPAAPVRAQQGPWGTVEGRITNATGRGLNEICVDYSPQEERTSQYSNPDGSWRLTLEPGDYIIQFTDCVYERGYFTEFYSADQNDAYLYEQATPLRVEANQSITGVDLVLELGGTIKGRITDPAGNPIEQICNGVSPKPSYGSRGGGSSDADGRYEMAALQAGRFKVFFQDCRSDPNSGLVSGRTLEWYRDAPSEGGALVLNVQRGKTIIIDVVIGGTDPPLSPSARVASGRTSSTPSASPTPGPSSSPTPTPTPTQTPTPSPSASFAALAEPAASAGPKLSATLGVLIVLGAAVGLAGRISRRRT